MAKGTILGVDPGTAKCGLALLNERGEVKQRAVVPLDNLPEKLRELAAQTPLDRVALGSRTGSRAVQTILERTLPGVPIEVVPEHRTTEEARQLYWHYHPPRGWRRLVPKGMLLPPEPVDGYAAELLARRLRLRQA